MKCYKLVFIFFLLLGCSGRDNEDFFATRSALDIEGMMEQIAYWQWEEKQLTDIPYQTDGIVDLDTAIEIRRQVFREIETDMSQKSQIFPTSAEVETLGRAVCVGYAVLIYKRLRDANFPDNNIGIIRYWNHCVAFVEIGEDIYYLDSYGVIKNREHKNPVIAFNLFGAWIL